MKCAAITSRASFKDYTDLYFILQRLQLTDMLDGLKRKLPILDENFVLKRLAYLEDIRTESLLFKRGMDITTAELKTFLQKTVKEYSASEKR